MSFYKQPHTYQCGPFALKYALIMLGKMENEKDIEEIAGSTWWSGTDEIGLEKAANYFDCSFIDINVSNNPEKSLSNLRKNLRQGLSAILCVDKWAHWMTVVNYSSGKYVCIDSGMKKVIIILSERELLKRWKYTDKKTDYYSGYVLAPYDRPKMLARFTIDIAKKLMSEKYSDLALNWDAYFNVLLELARSKNVNSDNTITFKEFLRRYQKSIVELVADWHGDIEYSELNDIFDNFLFVANVYNMVVHLSDINGAIIDLTCVLMMYATHNYGTYSYL